ncbi:LppU/SCO3897 family protein [Streptomyces sp. NPDC002004]
MTTPPPPQGQNPYASAPMGQQPGQPGVPPQQPYAPFPNQGGPVPPMGGAPVPPPPAPSKGGGKKVLRIIGGILVAIVVIVLKFGAAFGIRWFVDRDDAETTSVGACMHNDGTDTKADLNEVDCSSSDAQYKVVQKFDSSDEDKCKAVKESTVYYVQYGGGHDVVLCLKENK